MPLAEALGYLASGLVLVTFGMKTMVPMRIVAIASNLAFIAYGLSLELEPIWILHSTLLPLNTYRLLELLRRTRRLRDAAGGALSIEWLLPFMDKRRLAKEKICSASATSRTRCSTSSSDGSASGGSTRRSARATCWAISIIPPSGQRTVAAVCETDAEVLAVSHGRA